MPTVGSLEKSFWRGRHLSSNVNIGGYVDVEMMLENAKGQSKLPRWEVDYVGEEDL